MDFPAATISSFPSCTKSVTIRLPGNVIKLKQNREVLVNGEELTTLPTWIDGMYIRHASSIFLSGKKKQNSKKSNSFIIKYIIHLLINIGSN